QVGTARGTIADALCGYWTAVKLVERHYIRLRGASLRRDREYHVVVGATRRLRHIEAVFRRIHRRCRARRPQVDAPISLQRGTRWPGPWSWPRNGTCRRKPVGHTFRPLSPTEDRSRVGTRP